jgi:hypothetical protein
LVEELRRRRCPSEHSGHATALIPKSAANGPRSRLRRLRKLLRSRPPPPGATQRLCCSAARPPAGPGKAAHDKVHVTGSPQERRLLRGLAPPFLASSCSVAPSNQLAMLLPLALPPCTAPMTSSPT